MLVVWHVCDQGTQLIMNKFEKPQHRRADVALRFSWAARLTAAYQDYRLQSRPVRSSGRDKVKNRACRGEIDCFCRDKLDQVVEHKVVAPKLRGKKSLIARNRVASLTVLDRVWSG